MLITLANQYGSYVVPLVQVIFDNIARMLYFICNDDCESVNISQAAPLETWMKSFRKKQFIVQLADVQLT